MNWHPPPPRSSRPETPRNVHDIHPNGSSNRKEADDALDEEEILVHSIRFRSGLSHIGSSSDSDESQNPNRFLPPTYSGSNSTLREPHGEAGRWREAVAPANKSLLPTSPEEAKFTFTITPSAEFQTWNELSSVIPRYTSLRPEIIDLPLPFQSTFGRRAVPQCTEWKSSSASSCHCHKRRVQSQSPQRMAAVISYVPGFYRVYLSSWHCPPALYWPLARFKTATFPLIVGSCRLHFLAVVDASRRTVN